MAEKDLELTWEDMEKVFDLHYLTMTDDELRKVVERENLEWDKKQKKTKRKG